MSRFLKKKTVYELDIVLFRKTRRLHEITQKELAGKIGMPTSFLCDIERGNKKPNPKTAIKMAAHLERLI